MYSPRILNFYKVGELQELMENKNYISSDDLTLKDLKELGEIITGDMSIGVINSIIDTLFLDDVE